MGVWTRDGSVFNMKSVDSVTEGSNYVQGTMDVLTGNINLEIYPGKEYLSYKSISCNYDRQLIELK